ncbi:right-handed parallel beta-helix repeat-containing protein [Pontiella sulfatireligans]|uniref:Right handed beta helix domain-containing protein n=1 Tax=Pontiella sulfatireligans TaxID=2750658 RepID=A0A6C2UN16_9BACT|nr:right-handed parallel beta-helix repeat-containing protein [Pontiella sulfatireligans]VGO20671.1 hypothetical protein SCARR_02737 [Pontiella sulfatireligans]
MGHYRKNICAVFLTTCAAGILTASATDYYVSALNGNDTSNAGSLNSPFKTISKAAAVMPSGSRCFIREGIYRETVTVQQDQLYFGAFSNEQVVVSGCDLVTTPWISYSGQIEQTTQTNKVLQLFANGRRMNLARYPNEDAEQNMFSTYEWAASETIGISKGGAGLAQVVFSDIPNQPVDYWVGGYYTGKNGPNSFTAAVGDIISSSETSIQIENLAYWSRNNLEADSGIGEGSGYIINHINALDSAGEWYWNNSTLYYSPDQGINLALAAIEARTRLLGFVLDSKKNITLENIQFHAASLSMEEATDCLLTRCSFRYPAPWSNYSYSTGHDYGGPDDGSCGIFVSGENNLIANAYIAHSWGSGLRITGTNNAIEDSVIEDIDWCGRRMSGVQLLGISNRVTGCTIRECGREGIDGGQAKVGFEQYGRYHKVKYNRIENIGYLATDCGGFYINLKGLYPADLEIAYNEILHNHGGLYAGGIYMDDGTANVSIHHNLIIGPQQRGIVMNDGQRLNSDNAIIANNTIWDMSHYGVKAGGIYAYNPTNIYVANNLVEPNLFLFSTVIQSNNVLNPSSAQFADATRDDFHLIPNSIYENSGVEIPGITDGFGGSAPDQGAYETGQDWTAGSTQTIPPEHTGVDTDGDGVADIIEIILGTNPVNPDSNSDGTPDSVDYQDAGAVTLHLNALITTNLNLQFETKTNWYHSVQYTDDLLSETWNTIAFNIAGSGEIRQIDVKASTPGRFFRINSGLLANAQDLIFYDGFDHYSPAPASGTLFNSITSSWIANSNLRLYTTEATETAAESEHYFVQFMGATGGGSMSCTVPTDAGSSYEIRVALAMVAGSQPPPQLQIDITGSQEQTTSVTAPPDQWQYALYTFTATAAETTVTFTEPNINTAAQAVRLDSVRIYKMAN